MRITTTACISHWPNDLEPKPLHSQAKTYFNSKHSLPMIHFHTFSFIFSDSWCDERQGSTVLVKPVGIEMKDSLSAGGHSMQASLGLYSGLLLCGLSSTISYLIVSFVTECLFCFVVFVLFGFVLLGMEQLFSAVIGFPSTTKKKEGGWGKERERERDG